MVGGLIKNYVMVMKNSNLYLQSVIMLNIKMWHDLVWLIVMLLIGRTSSIRMGLYFKSGWQLCFCSSVRISRNILAEFIYRSRLLNSTTREWAVAEKAQTGRGRGKVFWKKPLEFVCLLLYPRKFLTKQSFTSETMQNSVIPLGNSKIKSRVGHPKMFLNVTISHFFHHTVSSPCH